MARLAVDLLGLAIPILVDMARLVVDLHDLTRPSMVISMRLTVKLSTPTRPFMGKHPNAYCNLNKVQGLHCQIAQLITKKRGSPYWLAPLVFHVMLLLLQYC